ncbi:MAG: glycosyltransferase family 4 protein [Deltaproteobacteria bacterium]|nr:glycosyltransferase family 4 protein [Deltaproteobacteria bacterium]
MKIALAHKRLDLRGGTERVLFRTAEGLRDRGHEVHLFCGEFRLPPPAGVIAHEVPYLPWPRTARLLSFALWAPKIIARHSCDVVMSFDKMARQDVFRSGGGPHRLFLEKMKKQSSWWRALGYRLSPYHRSVLRIERRQLGPAGTRKIIAVCDQVKRDLMEAYGLSDEKIRVIHNGVDLERFHPKRRCEIGTKLRDDLGMLPGRPVVLFVGTGFRRKGLDRLLSLWDRDDFRETYLWVVGNDAHLPRYRHRWGRKEILFLGAQSRVEDYYAAADLLVLPSVQEAFGNVVLEALASGLPIVTIRGVGATDQMDGPLREGILKDSENPEELRGTILKLLDPSQWPFLSREARRIAEKFSWEKYLNQVEWALREVSSGSPSYEPL